MKKRILFILHFPPPVHGSSVVGLQIKESKVINSGYDCRYVNLGTSKTIDEIGKNTSGKIFRYFSILSRVVQNLLFHRPVLGFLMIAPYGVPFYKDALVAFLFKLFRVKLVCHLHGKGVIGRQDNFFDNLLYRIVYKNTDVILLSNHLYTDIKKYVSIDKVQYCPNGIENLNMKDQSVIDNKQKDGVRILFLSNMIESKGVYVLLDACALLHKKKMHFNCVYIGDEGDITANQFNERVHKLDLNEKVSYQGRKLGKEKDLAFSEADIFIHPTFNDCFPLVIIEAMKFSLPVVSRLEGGIPDMIEDGVTGFIVLKHDTAEVLAEKLELLITDTDLRLKMGSAGRKKYEQNFTLQKFESNMFDILNKIIMDN